MLDTKPDKAPSIPFDTKRLDELMDQAGIDVLIANSKHNIQYLLGGHRSIFFDYMDAMGISRYLPILVYPKGAPEKAAFFGHRLESHQNEVAPFWTPEGNTSSARLGRCHAEGGRLHAQVRRQGQAHRRRDVVPAGRCGGDPEERPRRQRGQERPVRAGAAARQEAPGRARPAAQVLRAGRRFHEGRDRQDRPRHDQAGAVRDAAARGGQPRADVRVPAADGRLQPQPRPVGLQVRQGRYHVARLGRQLSRLHRRPLPHGHHRRAGCGAGGPAGRDRDDPARRHEADQGRRHGIGDLRRRRSAGARSRRTPSTCTSWRTAWGS